MKLPKGNEMAPSSKGTMDMISNAYILQWATICFTSGLKLVSRDMSPKVILSSNSWLWLTDDGILS